MHIGSDMYGPCREKTKGPKVAFFLTDQPLSEHCYAFWTSYLPLDKFQLIPDV